MKGEFGMREMGEEGAAEEKGKKERKSYQKVRGEERKGLKGLA